jgi:putative nucleotidyltransferase with HDIG domain
MNRIEWVAARAGDLPSLPQVARKILDRVRDPGATAAELGGIVSRDQALVTKLLRMSNSAMYGLREPVTDVRRAIVVLGFNTLRSTVLAAATQSLFQAKRTRLKDFLMWEHSLAVAVGSRLMAGEIGYKAPEEAFVAGLLHDVGKVVLDQNLDEQYQAVIESVFNDGAVFIDAERELLGFDHCEVGARVVQRWNLAQRLEEAVRLHHRPGEAEVDPILCAVVSLANQLAVKLEIGPERRPDLDCASSESARKLEVDEQALARITERLQDRLDEERALFDGAGVPAG